MYGGTGFVGSAVTLALEARGHPVVLQQTPRLRASPSTNLDADWVWKYVHGVDEALEASGTSVIVNCAGLSDAVSIDTPALYGANALWPYVLAAAANRRPHRRVIHVSSAAVQGAVPTLNSAPPNLGTPLAPYAASKAAGEAWILRNSFESTLLYRPPGVHHPSRTVTQTIARIARSRFATVASDGSQPTPQALLENVADAVAFLATTPTPTLRIIHHPWEGLTARQLLRSLGGHEPLRIPPFVASSAVRTARIVGATAPRVHGHARRLEVLLLGQEQEPSPLQQFGWEPPVGISRWDHIGEQLGRRPAT